ncbi:unnamed protein product [marine sediment metagenome]|uniref:DUF4145 domain-containing protein n=1 Tax=marine sediment metagenome TaxID=412755 RepID=X1AZN6_9ZZZZ
MEEDDQLIRFHKEIGRVKDDERLLVLVTHGFIELLLNVIVEAKCKRAKKIKDSQDYPHSVKLVLLNEIGLINDCFFEILDWFRRLRNKAAHEPFFALSDSDRNYVNRTLESFPPGRATGGLPRFCTYIVGAIWNGHKDILMPVFMTSIAEQSDRANK